MDDLFFDIKEVVRGERLSILVSEGIIDGIGPTCYRTYVGKVDSVDLKKKVIELSDVQLYTQVVLKEKWMPEVPRRSLGNPESEEVPGGKVSISKWKIIHRGLFFNWIP